VADYGRVAHATAVVAADASDDRGRVAAAAVVAATEASDDRARVSAAALVTAAEASDDRARVAGAWLVVAVGSTQPAPELVDTGHAGRRVHWLLELEIEGRAYRFAVEPLDVERADGTVQRWLAGLHPLELRLGTDGPPTASIVIDDVVDWARLVARGVALHAATATLRRWYEGDLLEEARVLLRGRVVDPDYGAALEPLSFRLERGAWVEPRLVPPPTAIVDARTWPITTTPDVFEPDPGILGASYPWVFGSPGARGGIAWGALGTTIQLTAPATPAYLAEFGGGAHVYRDSKLLLCDATWGVEAPTVSIVDASGGYRESPTSPDGVITEADVPVVVEVDKLGRSVAVADWSSAATVHLVPGNEYWVIWDAGGGILRADGSGPIVGAGEVIAFLLEQGGVAFDRGRQAAARARLDRYRLDFALVDPTDPERWVEEELGEIVPLVRRDGPDGVWYELFPYAAGPRDVVARLVVGGGGAGFAVERDGPVRWSGLEAIANEITLEYAAARGDRYLARRTLTGGEADTAAGIYPSHRCQVSHSRYGRRPRTISTRLVWDSATAQAILATLAAMYALPRRLLTLRGGIELDALEPGQVVEITDSGLYLAGALAVVVEVTMTLTGVGLEVELLDDPRRVVRETA